MSDALADEFLSFLAPPERSLAFLPGYRMQMSLQADAWLLWAQAQLLADGFWQPAGPRDADRKEVFVIPAHDDGAVIDLIAWRPAEPNQWYQRTCAIDLLGERRAFCCYFEQKPLKLWSTPAAWLLAEGDGACALRERALTNLGEVPEIHAETYELAKRIQQARERQWPEIKVMQTLRRAA
jgi:hypothetical protein